MRYLSSLPVFALLAACMAGCAPATVNLAPETAQQLRADNLALRRQVSDLQSSIDQLSYHVSHTEQEQDKLHDLVELEGMGVAMTVGMQLPDFLGKVLPMLGVSAPSQPPLKKVESK